MTTNNIGGFNMEEYNDPPYTYLYYGHVPKSNSVNLKHLVHGKEYHIVEIIPYPDTGEDMQYLLYDESGELEIYHHTHFKRVKLYDED